jgi:hypothetical protein
LRQKVAVVLTKGTNPSNWNVDDLKNMVKWFKLPLDPAFSTSRQELIQRYEQTKLRKMTSTILPDAAPMTADCIPSLRALKNHMALGLASVSNPMALDLASVIGPAVLAPTRVLAHAVAADVIPAVDAEVTLSVAARSTLSATSKEKKKK